MHQNPIAGDFFSHRYHGEPDLCGSRSYRIFPHRLPELSLLELWGRRLRRSLRCNGGSDLTSRRCLDHLHRWFGHFRWGRILCTYRRSDHGAPSTKVLEFRVEEFLVTEFAEKSNAIPCYHVVARGRPKVMSTNLYHGLANSLLFSLNSVRKSTIL